MWGEADGEALRLDALTCEALLELEKSNERADEECADASFHASDQEPTVHYAYEIRAREVFETESRIEMTEKMETVLREEEADEVFDIFDKTTAIADSIVGEETGAETAEEEEEEEEEAAIPEEGVQQKVEKAQVAKTWKACRRMGHGRKVMVLGIGFNEIPITSQIDENMPPSALKSLETNKSSEEELALYSKNNRTIPLHQRIWGKLELPELDLLKSTLKAQKKAEEAKKRIENEARKIALFGGRGATENATQGQVTKRKRKKSSYLRFMEQNDRDYELQQEKKSKRARGRGQQKQHKEAGSISASCKNSNSSEESAETERSRGHAEETAVQAQSVGGRSEADRSNDEDSSDDEDIPLALLLRKQEQKKEKGQGQEKHLEKEKNAGKQPALNPKAETIRLAESHSNMAAEKQVKASVDADVVAVEGHADQTPNQKPAKSETLPFWQKLIKKAKSHSRTQAQPLPQPKPQPQIQAQTQTQPQTQTQTQIQPQPQLQPQAQAQAQPREPVQTPDAQASRSKLKRKRPSVLPLATSAHPSSATHTGSTHHAALGVAKAGAGGVAVGAGAGERQAQRVKTPDATLNIGQPSKNQSITPTAQAITQVGSSRPKASVDLDVSDRANKAVGGRNAGSSKRPLNKHKSSGKKRAEAGVRKLTDFFFHLAPNSTA